MGDARQGCERVGDVSEYLALVDELTEHDRRYYVDAKPTISDLVYD